MRKENWTLWFFVILSIGLSIGLYCCRGVKDWDFDLYGALVGILSLLVTVLLAWNIINYLTFKREIKDLLEKQKENIKTEVNERIDVLINDSKHRTLEALHYTMGEVYSGLGAIYVDLDQRDAAFLYGINTISAYILSGDLDKANSHLDILLSDDRYVKMKCRPVFKDSILKVVYSDTFESLQQVAAIREVASGLQ